MFCEKEVSTEVFDCLLMFLIGGLLTYHVQACTAKEMLGCMFCARK